MLKELLKNRRSYFIYLLLLIAFVFSFIRFSNTVYEFSVDSLQMDFTAYYTAGKAVASGLSPYKNYIVENWNLWDGFAQYQHSRFLYPPLVAKFFQPFSSLPYSSAKLLWNIINVVILLVNLALLVVILGIRKIWQGLVVLITALNFFPFIALLERGQIDNLALFFILLAVYLSINKKSFFLSGVSLGIATLFKLYLLFTIPFLIFKKQWKLLVGYFVTLVSLAISTFIVAGTNVTYDYLTNQAPRIASFGSSGTQEMLIPVWILAKYFPMTPISVSLVQGKMYLSESISFNSKASMVKVIDNIIHSFGITLSPVFLSVIIFIVFFIIFYYIVNTRTSIIKSDNNYQEFLYWQFSLLIILLSSPYTWIMNLIWLFPSLFFVLHLWDKRSQKGIVLPLIIISIGYILLSIPDSFFFLRNVNIISYVIQARFIVAELILFIGFISLYRKKFNNPLLITNPII